MSNLSLIQRVALAITMSLGAGLLAMPVSAETAAEVLQSDYQIADNHMGGEETGTMMSSNTIVDVVSSSDSFETLVSAVKAADLVGTLSGPGPYTVFAPTDEAFAQLPEGALDFLLQPENEALLTQVLTYHVVPGEVTSSELTTGGISALGGGIAIGVYDSGVVVNNASVTNANIQADNGVIHQINRVLIPAALQQQLAARLGVSSLYQ